MYEHIISTDSLEWSPLDFPGVFWRLVYRDKPSGGTTVMTRIEAGASIPAHFHSRANESVFVLSGDFVEAAKTYGVGAFFVASAGVPHGPHESRTGCVVLTTFSAELDFQLTGSK